MNLKECVSRLIGLGSNKQSVQIEGETSFNSEKNLASSELGKVFLVVSHSHFDELLSFVEDNFDTWQYGDIPGGRTEFEVEVDYNSPLFDNLRSLPNVKIEYGF